MTTLSTGILLPGMKSISGRDDHGAAFSDRVLFYGLGDNRTADPAERQRAYGGKNFRRTTLKSVSTLSATVLSHQQQQH